MRIQEQQIPCFIPDRLADPVQTSQLPDGFEYAEYMSIRDIYRLYAPRSPLDPGEWEAEREKHRQVVGTRFVDIAVRNTKSSTIVGIGTVGFIHRGVTFAELSGFFVDPAAQCRGIGRAILDSRVAVASQLTNNTFVYKLADTNSLARYYEERHGFTRNGIGKPDLYKGICPVIDS